MPRFDDGLTPRERLTNLRTWFMVGDRPKGKLKKQLVREWLAIAGQIKVRPRGWGK